MAFFADVASSKEPFPQREPVYKRAEMILQSLAQTGEQLTKKNRGNDRLALACMFLSQESLKRLTSIIIQHIDTLPKYGQKTLDAGVRRPT